MRSREALAEIDRQRAAEVRTARLDARNPLSLEHALKATNCRFDFGKLGHEAVIARNAVTKQSGLAALDCFAPLAMTKRPG